MAQSGSGADISSLSGSPVVSIDGATITTRGQLYTALEDGLVHIFKAVGCDLSAYSANELRLGFWSSSSLFFEGTFLNFIVYDSDGTTKLHSYTGLGNDPWKDTFGSNDGTESGSFTRQLVSASDANDQIDAYGNAIDEPRTNAQVVNIFGEGELVKTLAAASLDTIKTVSGWIWHDGTARTVIDLGTPTVGTTATDLTSSGFTGVTYFVNGASGATLSAGWNHCIVASTVALATDDIDILAKSGSSIDYITTLTVAEALQNFDAQKARYNI